jgi:predicted TIM-barrel fold metal-dependent hydrolase
VTPFFDANAHPTVSGGWYGQERDASFAAFAKSLAGNELLGAAAVGLWNDEGYTHESYIASCRAYPKLIPIAGFAPCQSPNIQDEIYHLAMLGYRGVKIHPPSCGTDFHAHRGQVIETLQSAHQQGLVVMICTYFACDLRSFPEQDPFWDLARICKAVPEARVVLIHGGGTRVLHYADLVRQNPNLLLDLSLTIMKYAGSSVDTDLRFLLRTLDQRICVGSDWPEHPICEVRTRIAELAGKLSADKLRNICHRNVMGFLARAAPESLDRP